MHQEVPLPGELVTDCSWRVDTIPLEMNSMLHACYYLQENYTQNPQPLQGAELNNVEYIGVQVSRLCLPVYLELVHL